jgi:radical SAM superfamily enzyme YgiQ (UPF0313 family)
LLLVTPPFTQLNTPYPATAYLKGFLNTKGIASFQADLGIELILKLFSRAGLQVVFDDLDASDIELSENSYRIYSLKSDYLSTIEPVMRFLQHKNPTLAHSICDRTFLPEASRFQQLEDLEWAFGTLGIQDKARHLATLYLEDLGDLIKEAVDPHFGFSRYAERLGRSATHFDPIHAALQAPETRLSAWLQEILETKIQHAQPNVLCISVPFPGNLFGALKCGQYIKNHHPHIKVVMGGGFVNTELRSVSEERLFDYVDYLCLDDGEAPLLHLLEHLDNQRETAQLKRVFTRIHGVVSYCNGAVEKDIAQRETGTPDYSDLLLRDYLSVIEIANPMHRLWSDGRWNKLTLAHGCYWGKCSFCDISLDYIKNYEPLTAAMLCDRIETIVAQTGENGFHFVDEAAPPALLRDLAIEILRRQLTVVWWTNIRFEKNFSPDLCRLLKASGCIAVTGGLEVASDRLLTKMQKGVTVAQVARVADAFTQAGIMVHAYLMYGFPTQTAQETIDSLEMVRQLFENGVLQSGFWHLFAMTAHSPVGLDPAAFGVVRTGPEWGRFADNDLAHEDPLGADHELYAVGLRKSLFNYMHGVGLDFPLNSWFDVKTPRTIVPANYIEQCLIGDVETAPRPNALVMWLGNAPQRNPFEIQEGKKQIAMAELAFSNKKEDWYLALPAETGAWLAEILGEINLPGKGPMLFSKFQANYLAAGLEAMDQLLQSPEGLALREKGMLIV